jgi:hypothetical protein
MINKNELRENNKYFFSGDSEGFIDYENKIGTVILNDLKQFYVSFPCISNELLSFFDDANVNPIPLTKEILDKCGFNQLPHFTVQDIWQKAIGRNRVISIACVGTPNEMVFINEEEPPVVKNIIVARNFDYDGKTYLHHLQNLHYIFAGEELQYTP